MTLAALLSLALVAAPPAPAEDGAFLLSSESLMSLAEVQAEAAAACHAPTTCPDPKSCADWSSSYGCGEPICGIVPGCSDDCIDIPNRPRLCFGPGLRQRQEQFRVCFLRNGRRCTEFRHSVAVLGCGCEQ